MRLRRANRLREMVTEDEIAGDRLKWTGVPVTHPVEGEREKLLKDDQQLHERVVGQDEAVTLVAGAVIRAPFGHQRPAPADRQLHLSRADRRRQDRARQGARRSLVRLPRTTWCGIDMSEYMEKFSVSRLVGAPPGYVGYEEGGQLTEAVRRRPYCVILFDEIEKAHPDVFNVLLQVLDDGRMTDGQGRTVDFKNTVIVMTSNLGSQLLLEGITSDGRIPDRVRGDGVMKEVEGRVSGPRISQSR